MKTISSDDPTQPIRTSHAAPVRHVAGGRAGVMAGGTLVDAPRADDALIEMLAAIRHYATTRLDPEIAHLCTTAIGGNADAIAEVRRAIGTIDAAIVYPATNAIPEPVGTWGEEIRRGIRGDDARMPGVACGVGIGSR